MGKCESCKHYFDCMYFFCNVESDWANFEPFDFVEGWQVEEITVPFSVIA